MKITILGSSSSSPISGRHPSSQLLTVYDHHYLIDCGEGTIFRLNTFKIKKNKILAIFISHLHGDHFYGLIGLLTSMSMQERVDKLVILSPTGLQDIIDLQCKISKTQLRFPIEYIEFTDEKSMAIYQDKNIHVTSIPLLHKITTCGFLFEKQYPEFKINKDKLIEYDLNQDEIKQIVHGEHISKNGFPIGLEEISVRNSEQKKYAYLSDTEYCASSIPVIAEIDMLYHECTFLEQDRDRATQTKHSTTHDAANIAKTAGVKKLIVGHFSARYEDLSPILIEAKEIFPNTFLAAEGSTFEI